MMVSTRGRYALRFLLDLAEHNDGGFVAMKTVAQRQGISTKYLEQILPSLSRDKLVEVSHGKGGGYKLAKAPEMYTVGEILRSTEGDLAPVACLGCDAKECERSQICKTLPMWKKFNDFTNNYFDSITLAELAEQVVVSEQLSVVSASQ